jgi:hypothetical protein
MTSRPLRPADPAFSRNPKPPALAGGAFTGSFGCSKTAKIEQFFVESGLRGTCDFKLIILALTMTRPKAALGES